MIYDTASTDPFVVMCLSDYAASVAACEYWANKWEHNMNPNMDKFYEETYFFWDTQAFRQANLIGHDKAVELTAMVLSDFREMESKAAYDIWSGMNKAASVNFRSYVMSKQNIDA